jgi:hypothetical protein
MRSLPVALSAKTQPTCSECTMRTFLATTLGEICSGVEEQR